MKTAILPLFALSLLLSSCKNEEGPSVMFKLTLADSTVKFDEIYFNAYKIEGDQQTRVARNRFGGIGEIAEGFNGFKNEYPFVFGYFGFPYRQVENVASGFFAVELHTPKGIVTKRFGEIKGNSTRKEFETFIKADTVITAY